MKTMSDYWSGINLKTKLIYSEFTFIFRTLNMRKNHFIVLLSYEDVGWLANSLNHSFWKLGSSRLYVREILVPFWNNPYRPSLHYMESAIHLGTINPKEIIQGVLALKWPKCSRSEKGLYQHSGSWKNFISTCYSWPSFWFSHPSLIVWKVQRDYIWYWRVFAFRSNILLFALHFISKAGSTWNSLQSLVRLMTR